MTHQTKILFLLKHRHTYSTAEHSYSLSSGLQNSAQFCSDALNKHHFESVVVEVVDNNAIDAAVTKHKPDVVIIEALWVVPEKIDILRKLHPTVQWVIRLHSEIPFLSSESVAIDWIRQYVKMARVSVAFNSAETLYDFLNYSRALLHNTHHWGNAILLPNVYPVSTHDLVPKNVGKTLDVGLFGALRPLKAQVTQAMAAIEYCRIHDLNLRLHINSTRKDGEFADPILKNLRALFAKLPAPFILEEHDWLDREDFLTLVRQMDVIMQCSFSESFCIIAADSVSEGIPVVVSKEVSWVNSVFQADPTSVEDMVQVLRTALTFRDEIEWNRYALAQTVHENTKIWIHELQKLVS